MKRTIEQTGQEFEVTEARFCEHCWTVYREFLKDHPPVQPDLCPVCRIRPLTGVECEEFWNE